MSCMGIILYNTKEKRYVSRYETYKWKYSLIGGEPNHLGRRLVYKFMYGKKEGLLDDLLYIPIIQYADVDMDSLQLKMSNVTMEIRENRTDSGGVFYYGYEYAYHRKCLVYKEVIYHNAEELKEKLTAAVLELNEQVVEMRRYDAASDVPKAQQLALKGYALYLYDKNDKYVTELHATDNLDVSDYEIILIDDEELLIKLRI